MGLLGVDFTLGQSRFWRPFVSWTHAHRLPQFCFPLPHTGKESCGRDRCGWSRTVPSPGSCAWASPPYGVGVVVANPPVSEALFPVRRQEGGGNTRVAMHNLESTTALLRCGLMREGVLREAGPEPVEVAYDEAVELYEG